VIAEDVDPKSVDDLLGVLERTSGGTARLIDIPPLELAELRASLAELRSHADSLPSAEELGALYAGLHRTAAEENRSLLEVSVGVGLAFLTSAQKVSREHIAAPYREDWRPVRDEGFAAYAARVAKPYLRAISRHFDAAHLSRTERLVERLSAWRGRTRT
jgi:hypothetical protein